MSEAGVGYLKRVLRYGTGLFDFRLDEKLLVCESFEDLECYLR